MQTLYKRIENLEKAAVPVLRAHRRIAEQALAEVSDLESLISALGADREGRSLTEAESASRQAYGSAFERGFRQQLLRRPTESECIPGPDVIPNVIERVLACYLSPEQLDLAISGANALEQGRTPTEPESAAFVAATSETNRLYQLAGFRSEADFEIFLAQGGK